MYFRLKLESDNIQNIEKEVINPTLTEKKYN